MQNFSLIIPTLNEVDNIGPLLDRLLAMTVRSALDPEILFVDDGSRDGTREIIAAYAGPLNVRLIRRDHERGLTGAVVTGAQAAQYDFVVVMDSDLSHPPEAIPMLLAPLTADSHDMVIGSRYTEGGETPGWPFARRIASQLASLPARLLTGVYDPLAGFFAVHRQQLAMINRDLTGFKVGLEVLAAGARSLRVAEVPITFQDRSRGISKMNMTILGKYLRQLLRLTADRLNRQTLLPLTIAALLAGLFDASVFSLLTHLGFSLDLSHVASFLLTAALYYGLVRLVDTKASTQPPRSPLRYTCICLLLLFLRGGIVATPSLAATPPSFLLTLILGLGSSLSLAAAHIYIGKTTEHSVNWKVFGSLVIGYTILLRLVYLGNIELIQEEAYYWNYSQHLAFGYLDHPPVVALLIHLGTLLFGNTEFGVRIGAFSCWFFTAFFTFRLAGTIFDRATGYMAVVLVAILPIFFGVSLVITPDAPLIACWSGALYFLYRALVEERNCSWYGAGICLGIGLASKYTIALLGPAIVLFMLMDISSRKWFTRREPYLAALLAILIFSPVIWWNFQHDWASFLFQSKARLDSSPEFSTHELLASILVLITPTGFMAALVAMNPWSRLRQNMGVAISSRLRRGQIFALTMTLIPLSVFILFSISKEIKLNWTGPIWLAVLPFMARTMTGAVQNAPRYTLSRVWPATLMVLMLAYGTLLHYCAIGLPGVWYGNSRNFLFGWDDLASQVEEKVRTISKEDGERPLVAGLDKYRLASGLAFYRSKHHDPATQQQIIDETTAGQLFGGGSLMYKYWHPQATAVSRDILVISQDPEALSAARLAGHGRQLGNIGEFSISKHGKKSGSYYYRLLTWYSADKNDDAMSYSPPPPADTVQKKQAAQMAVPRKTDRKDAIL